MLFHDYLSIYRHFLVSCSLSPRPPPLAEPDGGMGGTSPEASTKNPEVSVQRLGGGDQSRGIKKSETTTLVVLSGGKPGHNKSMTSADILTVFVWQLWQC